MIEDIQSHLNAEAEVFVNRQIEWASMHENGGDENDVALARALYRDALDQYTNVLNVLTGYRSALRDLSNIVDCEEAILIVDAGRKEIHQKMADASFYLKP